MQTTRILLSVACQKYRREIEYACDEISLRLGRPLLVVSGETAADVFYGPAGADTELPHIVFDARSYDKHADAKIVRKDGFSYWGLTGTVSDKIDHIGSVFRLLNFLDETVVGEDDRNSRGIFDVSALSAARQETASDPLVENHARALAKQLYGDDWVGEAIWPEGKKMAVLLTHDTDLAALRAPQEILFNAGKAALRLDRNNLRLAGLGVRSFGPANRDPGFGFPAWREIEDALPAKSCFFLGVRETAKRALNDVRSSVLDYPEQIAYLKAMARDGFEFGLHAAIHAKDSLDEFILAKRRIEDLLETPIWGTRHHYWSIDWRNPCLTYRKHLNAGFRYDCSISWRDRAGFRAGTSLPFRPFDPGRGRAQRLYLLPTAIMDGHLTTLAQDPVKLESFVGDLVKMVRQSSGVLCLDWHTEYAAPAFAGRGEREILQKVLSAVDRDAWFTTPKNLVAHWHARYMRILGAGFYER